MEMRGRSGVVLVRGLLPLRMGSTTRFTDRPEWERRLLTISIRRLMVWTEEADGLHNNSAKVKEASHHICERCSEPLREGWEGVSINNRAPISGEGDLLGGVSALQKTDLTGPILFLNCCQR